MNILSKNTEEINKNINKNSNDLEYECRDHMLSNNLGLSASDRLELDGSVHRYAHIGNNRDKSEWYIGSFNDIGLIVTYGSHRGMLKFTYMGSFGSEMDYDAKSKMYLDSKALEEKAAKEHEESFKKAAEYAASLMIGAAKEPNNRCLEYPTLKKISPLGAKFRILEKYGATILVPLVDINDKIWNVQLIFKDRTGKFTKRFLPGSKTAGCFHIINNETLLDGDLLYVCEGWATGISVYEAIRCPTTHVIAAMSMHNIGKVVEQLRAKYPSSRIIIAADGKEHEIKAANDVALKHGLEVAYPSCTIGTDFNDVHQQYGLGEVKRQLEKLTLFEGEAEKLKKLAQKLLEKDDPCANFPVDQMPEVIRDLTDSICSRSSANPVIVVSTLLSVASAFIGKKYIVEHNDDDGFFTDLYCNLWVICVAPSGQFKSTALNAGCRLAMEEKDKVIDQIIELKREIGLCEDKAEKKQLASEFPRKELELLKKDKMLPNSVTPERLIEILAQDREGVIISNEIGGFIKDLVKKEMMATFTEFYDVKTSTYAKETKTQGNNYVRKPFISIMGVSTIDWINNSIKDSDTLGGFYPRFLIFSLPDKDIKPPSLPRFKKKSGVPINLGAYSLYKAILLNLDTARSYTLSEGAIYLYDQLFSIIYDHKKQFDDATRDKLGLYIMRWSAYVIKISLIMQVFIDSEEKKISEKAIFSAFMFVLPAIKSTISLYEGEFGESPFDAQCRNLYEWICRRILKTGGKPITKQQIYESKAINGIRPKEYQEIIERLVESGKIMEKKMQRSMENTYTILDTNQ